jgi:hypothetical protein
MAIIVVKRKIRASNGGDKPIKVFTILSARM